MPVDRWIGLLASAASAYAVWESRKSRRAAEASASAATRQAELAEAAETRRTKTEVNARIRFARAQWAIAAAIHGIRPVVDENSGSIFGGGVVPPAMWKAFEEAAEGVNRAREAVQIRGVLESVGLLQSTFSVTPDRLATVRSQLLQVEGTLLQQMGFNLGDTFPTEEEAVDRATL